MEQIARNAISDCELMVLNCLGEKKSCEQDEQQTSIAEVVEISNTTGIKDNDEVLRALYTLEGKNLVSPEPAGDFTSSQWQITEVGLKALRLS